MKTNPWYKIMISGSIGLLSYPIASLVTVTAVSAAPFKLRLPPPPARGIAGSRTAAASRTNKLCPSVPQPLTALVPQYESAQVWGLTAMERPTFWVYIPYDRNSSGDISFTLQDESDPQNTQIIYQNPNLTPPSTPGLMSISLPKSIPPLAPNKTYKWHLELKMGCTKGSRPMYVDGYVQRQELDPALRDRLQQATLKERFLLYSENGLWYDALTTLAILRVNQPQDLALNQDWKHLLQSVDLGSLADRSVTAGRQSPNRPIKNKGF